MHMLLVNAINLRTKFEMSNFIRSKDMTGVPEDRNCQLVT